MSNFSGGKYDRLKTMGLKKNNFWPPKVDDLGEGNNKIPADKMILLSLAHNGVSRKILT